MPVKSIDLAFGAALASVVMHIRHPRQGSREET